MVVLSSVPALTASANQPYRSVPHNLTAEQELLGAILTNNEVAAKVSDFLLPEHFHHEAHRRIYQAALTMIERGELADPVTLKPYFERDEAMQSAGGPAYLAQLAGAATSIISAEHYARLILDLALRRALIGIGEETVNTAFDSEVDVPAKQQIENAEQQLFGLAQEGRTGGGFQAFTVSIRQSIQMVDAAHRRGGLSGVPTGLIDLDEKLGGLQKSDLIILAGRPSMGKTALATTIAFNAANAYLKGGGDAGARVGFFSLEMSAEQLATRILAEQTGISSERLRRGEVSDEDFIHKLVPASQTLAEVPLFIDDTGAISISALRTRARRLKRVHDINLIVIDYLQLVRPASTSRSDGRVQEISEITQALKALAKDLNVPVLALSQLSRAVENRDDKRPQLSDLRESGAIEQDADVVMFVYREEYYELRKEPRKGAANDATWQAEHAAWQERMDGIHNLADIIIGKQRHGPTGNVTLRFEPALTKFDNYTPEDHHPAPF
jgi:replicative DNA helicase